MAMKRPALDKMKMPMKKAGAADAGADLAASLSPEQLKQMKRKEDTETPEDEDLESPEEQAQEDEMGLEQHPGMEEMPGLDHLSDDELLQEMQKRGLMEAADAPEEGHGISEDEFAAQDKALKAKMPLRK